MSAALEQAKNLLGAAPRPLAGRVREDPLKTPDKTNAALNPSIESAASSGNAGSSGSAGSLTEGFMRHMADKNNNPQTVSEPIPDPGVQKVLSIIKGTVVEEKHE